MLKIVPVCGGGSVLNVEGSTCGRAGRLFFRMIFLTFLPSALMYVPSSVFVIVMSVDVAVSATGESAAVDAEVVITS